MGDHDWIKSTLGHGDTMCRNCKVTNREAAVLGMDQCDSPNSKPGNPNTPKKSPPNTPSVGDRVRLRGRQAWGELKSVTPELWAQVRWVTDGAGPKLVHLHELEKI